MPELVGFIFRTGLVAKIVLTILFLLSLASWTIIFEKLRLFLKSQKESNRFLRLFDRRTSWNELYRFSQELRFSPFAQVFKRNYKTLQSWHNRAHQPGLTQSSENPLLDTFRSSSSLKSALEIIISDEIALIEKRLIFLATTVSVSPFLGLLGTVWGIMTAFLNMGIHGSADITAVGPGIAEALITTIAGLAVAIPTVIAYNYFVDKLQRLENELDNFATELVLIVEEEQQS